MHTDLAWLRSSFWEHPWTFGTSLFAHGLTLFGEKPGSEPEEAKLQTTSRQIVQNAILRAVQQVSRESQSRRRDTRAGDTARGSLQPGAGESAKKHEK
ncbi:A-kinase anchor protein inhibitor 1 isoform X1 [Ovis canadensis]|uniref:A-kinase anchor protein inhibitor 1 isoform X1 n=1 Tax=Ovis canadensis TaxID=37174 RepID=UPI003750A5DC